MYRAPFAVSILALSSACTTVAPHTGEPWSERFIDPVSAGTTFESPVIETGLEAHAVAQSFPDDSVFGGGGFGLLALQARLALNEHWALIATKDGYIDLDPDVGTSESGTADLAGGFKFVAHADPDAGVLVTPGLIVEFATGDEEVFQGNGDGLLRPFVAAGWDRGRLNLLGAFGYNHPLDDDEESSSIDYHFHASYEVADGLFPLVELNGITYTGDGTAFPADFEGGDLINLGSTDVSGNTVISGALGLAYTLQGGTQLGITYEQPLTSREDLLDDRLWIGALFRF